MAIVNFLLSLLDSPLAALLIPVVAEKLGLDEAKLRAFIAWLSSLSFDQQAAVGARISPAFSFSSAADCGCDLPDCPHEDVIEVLQQKAAA